MHRRGTVAALLFCSGLCALVYQTAWLREFRLIFGASTFATGAVLAIFMGGLGAGSVLLGKRADLQSHPLAWYGKLELVIALSAAASPLLLALAAKIYFASGGQMSLGITGASGVRLIMATLVLAIPTVAMGGTLPAAVRAVETPDDVDRRGVALLYGVNTAGAVAGTLLGTFYLLENLGTRTTLYLAVALNIIVAVAALVLSRTREVAESIEATADEQPGPMAVRPFAVYGAAATVGFAFLLMELVWYRMLSPILGGTTFMFGLILAQALAGVALGGLAYAFWSGRGEATAGAFALTCSLEAVAVVLPLMLGDRVAMLAVLLRDLGTAGFHGHVLAWTVVTSVVILPAAFIAGVQFPLLIALLGRGREDVGRQVGAAYAWNTLGAIGGSLAGGFGLLPLLSAPGCWRVVTLLLAGVGLTAAVLALRQKQQVAATAAALAAVFAVGATFAEGPTSVWRHAGIGVGQAPKGAINDYRAWMNYQRRTLLWEEDGRESSIGVVASSDLAFIVNGKSDGSARGDAATQVMGGLIGAILHPQPRTAMVIGLGGGSTAGWLAKVPSMERVDAIELEPVVLDYARLCTPVNADALRNPKVRVHIADAREALLTSRATYDIIFSEPSNPYRAGIASLFTREFYEAAAQRLNRKGIFLQWLQMYGVDAETMRMVYATLHSVFPHVETWNTGAGDLILLATKEPVQYDAAALRGRLRQEPFRSAAHFAWRAENAEAFLARFIANDRLADRIASQGSEVNTDDRTPIEFSFARAIGSNRIAFDEVLRSAERLGASRPAKITGAVDWGLVEANRSSWMRLARNDPHRRFAEAFQQGDYASALAVWREKPWPPVNTIELSSLAFVLAEGSSSAAAAYAEQLRPWNAIEADTIIARLRIREKRFAEAASLSRRAVIAYRSSPWPRNEIAPQLLDNIVLLARAEPRLAAPFIDLLNEPFILGLQNDQRRLTRVWAAYAVERCGPRTVKALVDLEPHPEWSASYLAIRAECYARSGLAIAEAAARDLREHAAAERGSLIR